MPHFEQHTTRSHFQNGLYHFGDWTHIPKGRIRGVVMRRERYTHNFAPHSRKKRGTIDGLRGPLSSVCIWIFAPSGPSLHIGRRVPDGPEITLENGSMGFRRFCLLLTVSKSFVAKFRFANAWILPRIHLPLLKFANALANYSRISKIVERSIRKRKN